MDAYLQKFLQYIRFERGYAANTVAAYHSDLEQMMNFLRENRIAAWRDLTAGVLEAYVAMLQDRAYSVPTVLRKVAAARSFLTFLFSEGLIPEAWADWLRQPKGRQRLPYVLSEAEVTRLLEAASGEKGKQTPRSPLHCRDRALLELLYATGLRATEVVNLSLNDVDFVQGRVRCVGKGNKERWIPLYPSVCAILRRYIEDGRKKLLEPTYSTDSSAENRLFLNHHGHPLTRQGVWFILKQRAEEAGLAKKVTPHTLRHTFATHLLDGGADLREVQQFLGHANITTTQIYTKVSNRRKRRVYDQAHPRARKPSQEFTE
jgi:integrase/recombinase XerD